MTAMNESYWNEYSKIIIDEKMLKNTLKYFQTTLSSRYGVIRDFDKEKLKQLYDWENITFSDVNEGTFSILELNSEVKLLVENIIYIYSKVYPIVTMPILYIGKNCYELPIGFYSINSLNKEIALFKTISEKKKEEEENENYLKIHFGLYFYLNIEDSIAYYQNKGLLKGVQQVGEVIGKVDKIKNFTNINSLELIEQYSTNFSGINLRKSLLIDYIFFEKEYRR